MSGSTAVRTPPASQLARRERILDAAIALASEGGYDAVQMREVAERADVALGTLYRYFPSKVHLLVSALGRTFVELETSVAPAPMDASPADRVYKVVAASTRYLTKNRRLSGAMIRALVIADADAGPEVDAVAALMVRMIATASHEPGISPTERDELVAHIIGKVWLTDVLTLLTRRMTVSQVLEDLESTINLVMPGS
ncbi:MAG TPA: TetR family transcriptional regulator [Mycobacteriales bacterium]|nr:TetR family transcriptional regulator [Mycobacteriales bacterium]